MKKLENYFNKIRKKFSKSNNISLYKFKKNNSKHRDMKKIFREIYSLLSQEFKRTKQNIKHFDIKSWKNINIIGIVIFAVALFGIGYLYLDKEKLIVNESKDEAKLYKILNDGERFYYAKEYDKAIDKYLEFVSKDDNPIWYAKISEVLSVKGQYEEAKKYIEHTKNALAKYKEKNDNKEDYGDILNYIVFNEFINKDYDNAIKDGEEALKEVKDHKRLNKTMLATYIVSGNIDKAQILLNNYSLDKKSSYDMAEYARMLILLDRWDEGFKVLKEAWYLDKDEYKIYDVIAQMSDFNRDLMLQKIGELINNNKEEICYKVWLSKVYSIRPETKTEALSILNELREQDIGKIQVRIMTSLLVQSFDKDDEVFYERDTEHFKEYGDDEIINSIIREYGDDYRVLHTAGWYYLNKKDYKRAMDFCIKSMEKNKDYPDNYGFLIPAILKGLNRPNDGEPYFRTALYEEPYNYNIALNIANFYWHTNQNSERANEYFYLASLIRPKDAEIKYNMAMIYINANNMVYAIDALNQCIKIDETVPKYHRTLGAIYMTLGKTEEGIKETRRAYDIDKNDILNMNNAGCYYINFTDDVQRGVYNITKAHEGLSNDTDKYIKDTITQNYNKVKKLIDDIEKAKGGDDIEVPELILFY